jgi:hypothetical protein
MSHDSMPPIDPSLEPFLDAERASAQTMPDALRHRLESRVAASLALGAGNAELDVGHSSDGTAGSGARAALGTGKLSAVVRGVGLAVVSAGVGAALHASVAAKNVEVRYVDRLVYLDAGTAVVAPESSAVPSALVSPGLPTPSHVIVGAPSPSTAPSSRDEALARERVMVEAVRSALARRDALAALAAADKHQRTFPKGQLGEEREALAVQALVLAGRGAEARARGEKFRQKYPRGLFTPVVDDALSKIP